MAAIVLACLCASLLAAPAAPAAERSHPAVLLIMDSSGSMRADDGSGRPKIAAAKDALNRLVDRLPPGAPAGLRVYGHRVPDTDKRRGCRDTELIAPVGPLDKTRMKARIASFEAKGFTPIGRSLLEGAGDLPPAGERTMILVSDGIDTCAPPSPCQVARQIVGRGIDVRIETVGFQVDPKARAELQCIARVGRGSYVDAANADELAGRLEALSVRALRNYRTRGQRVRGGPSPGQATLLTAGQYVDTLAPDEELWFAVQLERGQAVRAAATLIPPGGRQVALLGSNFELQILNPAREEDLYGRGNVTSIGASYDKIESVGAWGQTVGVDSGYGSDRLYAQPGPYLLRFRLEDVQSSDLAQLGGKPFQLEFIVNVLGEPPPPPARAAEARPPPATGDKSVKDDLESLFADLLPGLILAVVGFAGGAAGVSRLWGRRA